MSDLQLTETISNYRDAENNAFSFTHLNDFVMFDAVLRVNKIREIQFKIFHFTEWKIIQYCHNKIVFRICIFSVEYNRTNYSCCSLVLINVIVACIILNYRHILLQHD